MELKIIKIEGSSDIDSIKKEYSLEEVISKEILFPTESDATEYLKDISQIYTNVITNYQEPLEDFIESDLYIELYSKVQQSVDNYVNYPDKVIERFATQKSSTKGCPNCKSTISKDYYIKKLSIATKNLKAYHEEQGVNHTEDYKTIFAEKRNLTICPICDEKDFLFNETDLDKLKKLEVNIKTANDKYNEEQIIFQAKVGNKTVALLLIQD
jgi:RNA polymerase subunit RPABC4/transcription elongation factor Spt4